MASACARFLPKRVFLASFSTFPHSSAGRPLLFQGFIVSDRRGNFVDSIDW